MSKGVDEECHNDVTLWSIVRGFVRENPGAFVLYSCSILSIPLQDVLVPHLAGLLYKSIREPTAAGGRKKTRDVMGPVLILLAILGVILVVQVLGVVDDKVDQHLYPAMQHYVRGMMLSHQFEVNSTEYRDAEVGDLVTVMTKMPTGVYYYVDIWKHEIVPHAVAVLACTAYIAWIVPWLGGVILLVVVACVSFAVWRFRACCRAATARDEQHASIIRGVDDVLSNMRTVISFGRERQEIDSLGEKQVVYARLAKSTLDCTLAVKCVSMVLVLGFVSLVAYVCIKDPEIPEHLKLTLLIVSFIVANSSFHLTTAYKRIVIWMGTIRNSLSAFEVCPRKPPRAYEKEKEKEKEPEPESDPTVCVRVDDVSYSYPGSSTPIFEHLDLAFERGKATAVVGDIGAGKSTLVSLLMGYLSPDSGALYLDGVPYALIDPADLRRRVFLLPQSPLLLNRSIYENITFGVDRDVSRREVEQLVEDLGLGDFLQKAGGLDRNAGVRGGQLSGGQRQIVWLLKLFLVDPEVAVLDEPTASLDPETKIVVARLVVHAMRSRGRSNKTVILSTHDAALIDEVDVVVRLRRSSGGLG